MTGKQFDEVFETLFIMKLEFPEVEDDIIAIGDAWIDLKAKLDKLHPAAWHHGERFPAEIPYE